MQVIVNIWNDLDAFKIFPYLFYLSLHTLLSSSGEGWSKGLTIKKYPPME